MEAMGVVVDGVFLLAAVAAVRLWVQRRSVQAAWIAATFVAIATVLLAALVIGDDGLGETAWLGRLLVLVLLASPYLLFRFADSVASATRWGRRLGDAGAVLMALVVLVLPVPDTDATLSPLGLAYLVFVLGAWLALSLAAGWLLWRGSIGESAIVRNRLRVLAVGAVGLGLVLPVSAVAGEEGTASLVIQGTSAGLGLLFLVGFAPPSALRASWRAPDERRMYAAAVGFMNAESSDDVASVLVPGVRLMMGASVARLRDADGTVVAEDRDHAHDRPGVEHQLVTARVGERVLEVEVAPTVPLFGPDEDDELDRLALLADLAFERTRLLASEREVRADLERVNDDLESFVYTTSHDLKNPLLAILGYLEVIREDHADEVSEEFRHHLDRMAVNTQHMEALIRDLLELSRVGRVDVQPEPVDLGALVDDVGGDVRSESSRLHVVRDQLPTLWMNRTRARQLFTNLFDNAARHAAGDEVTVTVTATTEADRIRLRVRDDGQGIPEEHLERVFGVFERLDPEDEGGTGMGLAICRRVVELLGGRMHAEPCDDGASFVLDLPATLRGDETTDQQRDLLDRSAT